MVPTFGEKKRKFQHTNHRTVVSLFYLVNIVCYYRTGVANLADTPPPQTHTHTHTGKERQEVINDSCQIKYRRSALY
jgi:hypothetical protein